MECVHQKLRCVASLVLLLLLQGIELYKDNLALNERMNAYYAAVQVLPALKWVNYCQLSCAPLVVSPQLCTFTVETVSYLFHVMCHACAAAAASMLPVMFQRGCAV